MTIEKGYSDGEKQLITIYGSEEEILTADMTRNGTGSFGVTPALDVYYYTEGEGWTKNGEAV